MNTRAKHAVGLGAALLALAWVLPAAAKTASWDQFGYDSGHTGFNNSESKITAKNVTSLVNIANLPVNAEMKAPVVYKGTIYIRSLDGNVYAFDLASGQQLWSVAVPLPGSGSNDDIAISDNRLIVPCYIGSDPNPTSGICALDPKTGAQLWTYWIHNGGPFTAPVIAGNTIYLGQSGVQPDGNNTGAMVAVNLKTGKERWRFWSCTGAPVCMNMSASAPAVDNGIVYFGCRGGSGFSVTLAGDCALDASTGAVIWNQQIGVTGHEDNNGLLIARNGTVYQVYSTVNCYQCTYTIDILALNGATGATMWDRAITGNLNESYRPTGTPTLGPGGTTYQAISTSNNPNQPNLFAVNADGTIKWQVSTLQNLGNTPTIVGSPKKGVLFYACYGNGTAGTTCAYNPKDGSLLWSSLDTYLASRFAPVVTGGVVYNDCYFNSVCAYTSP